MKGKTLETVKRPGVVIRGGVRWGGMEGIGGGHRIFRAMTLFYVIL